MDKKEARRAAARLRNLGKMVAVPRTPEERLREAQQAVRSEDAYGAAGECSACLEVRRASGDPTALCAPHLAQAMGM